MRISQTDYRVMKMKDSDVISGEFWTMNSEGNMFVLQGEAKNLEGLLHVCD